MGIMLQVRDRAWLVRLYGDNPRALASGLSTVQADEQYFISSLDKIVSSKSLALSRKSYGIQRSKQGVIKVVSFHLLKEPRCSVS